MNYVFKFKRKFFYRSATVQGHRYDEKLDKMVMYFPDGTVEEIPSWKNCSLKLGTDWVASQKKFYDEQKAQQAPAEAISINR